MAISRNCFADGFGKGLGGWKGIESIEGYERYTFCTLKKLGFFWKLPLILGCILAKKLP